MPPYVDAPCHGDRNPIRVVKQAAAVGTVVENKKVQGQSQVTE